MDINSVFIPNIFSDQERTDAFRHQLWPLILGTHLAFDGRLVLSGLSWTHATMATTHGCPILMIGNTPQGYRLNMVDHPLAGAKSSLTNLATTANSRYLLARLRKKEGGRRKRPLRTTVFHAIQAAETVIVTVMRDGAMCFARHAHPHKSPDAIALSTSAQQWALLVAYGKKLLVEVPADIRTILDTTFSFHDERNSKIAQFTSQVQDLLDRDKWVLGWVEGTGIIAGKVRLGGFVPAITGYTQRGFCGDINWTDVNTLVPFTLYKSVSSMPEEHRREVEAALTMAKINRGTDTCTYADSDGLIPASITPILQPRIGCISWNANASSWTMVDA